MSESRAIPDLDLTGRSSDGLVTVVCDSRGSVRSVEVSPREYADKGSEVLAADMVTAVTAARQDVERKVAEITRGHPTGLSRGCAPRA
ncbi:YbaB/EbfC family nucleoid-associated protein [Spirillospora sp. NPDC127506]|jgi:DNA-binding protein YbaB